MNDGRQRMLEMSQAFAGFTADCWCLLAGGMGQAGGEAAAADLRSAFGEHFRRLLTPPMPPLPPAGGAAPEIAAALSRCQRAGQALTALISAAAADAGGRFVAELSRSDPGAEPIGTLRELHTLWIECGEQAWASAVHQDAYAAAQAEWLASLVELQLVERRLRQSAAGPPA